MCGSRVLPGRGESSEASMPQKYQNNSLLVRHRDGAIGPDDDPDYVASLKGDMTRLREERESLACL